MEFVSLLIAFFVLQAIGTRAQSSAEFDICVNYKMVCRTLLNKINCPNSKQIVIGCPAKNGTIATLIGRCRCKSLKFITGSVRIQENFIDNRVKKFVPNLLVYSNSNNITIDLLHSYTVVCKETLKLLSCPTESQKIVAGRHGKFVGICECGTFQAASTRVAELIVDSVDAIALPPSPINPWKSSYTDLF